MTNQLVEILNTELAIELPEKISFEELKEKLSQHINDLINSDFQKLVAVLYRVDVSEHKLKTLLNENAGENTGSVIADLIIERQFQKIKSRQQFRKQDNDIDENEKW
jgi:hypothetical protein